MENFRQCTQVIIILKNREGIIKVKTIIKALILLTLTQPAHALKITPDHPIKDRVLSAKTLTNSLEYGGLASIVAFSPTDKALHASFCYATTKGLQQFEPFKSHPIITAFGVAGTLSIVKEVFHDKKGSWGDVGANFAGAGLTIDPIKTIVDIKALIKKKRGV
jgi:hypothetical protein